MARDCSRPAWFNATSAQPVQRRSAFHTDSRCRTMSILDTPAPYRRRSFVARSGATAAARALPAVRRAAVRADWRVMGTRTQVESALLRFPEPSGRRWLAFDRPRRCIVADRLDEVTEALRDADAAAGAGHWVVGFVSYDASPAFDPALVAHRDPAVPLVAFGVFDEPITSRGPSGSGYRVGDWEPSITEADHAAAIARIHEHIRAGDTYQVNMTYRLRTDFSGDPLGLFAALSRSQRADHLAYVRLTGAAVCSASPELFFHRSGRDITSRPMKGTRPRHPDPRVDDALASELLRSAKDRAENVMIVDMVRNDLGRIAEVGSVAVPRLHSIEPYPTVHQMTSTVTARTDAGLVSVFGALFPGASITGAPKIRTSEIIAGLEGDARGVYTGAVGAIAPDGRSEFNIAIRTVWIDLNSGRAEYGVGGGIVADSTAEDEWVETRVKARVLERVRPDLRLLETMGWEPDTGALLLDRHLDRLRASAEHFGFDLDVTEARRLVEAVSGDGPRRLRLLLAPDGAIDLAVTAHLPKPPTPWRVPLAERSVHSGDEMLYHKTTRREVYARARAQFPDAADVILTNERDEVTETTIGNLVLDLDGTLVTPARSSGLLPGTFRAELLAAGTVEERVVTLADLRDATDVSMINSVRGWVAVHPVFADRPTPPRRAVF